MWRNFLQDDPVHLILSCRDPVGWTMPMRLDYADGSLTCFVVTSSGNVSEGYGHGGPGVCLGDGQTEAYLKGTGMVGLASV